MEGAQSVAFHCPHCGSDHTQRFSVIHRNGTSAIDTKSAAIGFGTRGAFGGGGVRTTGTSQTGLASDCAPPQKKRTLLALILTIVIYSVANNILGFGSFVILLIGLGVAYHYFNYNRTKFPEHYLLWQKSFMCLRCDRPFVVHDLGA